MLLKPIQFFIIGLLLEIFGVVVPYLMVMRILEPTFLLSFCSYAAQFTGLLFGIIGIATYTKERRGRSRHSDHDR